MSRTQDQSYLVNEQYKNADNLRARIELHERFSTFRQDFHRWVFDQMEVPDGARVLELGTGPANFWVKNKDRIPADWQVTLTDLSPGMVEEAETETRDVDAQFNYKVADAQTLPFDANSFDIVMANHMLYHVPDLDKTIAEVRRVLKPGGVFYAATNGADHMRELDEFAATLTEQHLPGITFELMSSLSFRLENGAEALAKQFADVTMIPVPDNALKVTEAEPFMHYLFSMNRLQSQLGDVSQAEVDSVVKVAYREARRILEQGPIHVTKSTGLFIAS